MPGVPAWGALAVRRRAPVLAEAEGDMGGQGKGEVRSEKSEVMIYVYAARHECGLIVAAVVDDPALANGVARIVSTWIRRGHTIERMPIEEARKTEWCLCFRKGRKRAAA